MKIFSGKNGFPAFWLLATFASLIYSEPVFSNDGASSMVLRAIELRLGAHAVVVSQQRCDQRVENSPLSDPEFAIKFIDGVYVVCDIQSSDNQANARIFRFLVPPGHKIPVASERVDATLEKAGRRWGIRRWKAMFLEYPPLPTSDRE